MDQPGKVIEPGAGRAEQNVAATGFGPVQNESATVTWLLFWQTTDCAFAEPNESKKLK